MKQDIFELARSVLKVSRNTLAVHLRFMDMAISRLRWISIPEIVLQKPELLPVLANMRLATEGTAILYDPLELCRRVVAELGLPPLAVNPIMVRTCMACL